MILCFYLLVCSNSLLKGMELWNLRFRELINPLLGWQDFTSGLPSASFQNSLPPAPLLSPSCGTMQRGWTKSKILKSSVGGTWASAQDFTWCVSSQVFRREKASKACTRSQPSSKPTIFPFATEARTVSELSPEQAGEVGTSLPEALPSGTTH